MQKTYRDELLLRTCHCDMQGRWRPSAILEAMQEAAGTHAELLAEDGLYRRIAEIQNALEDELRTEGGEA